MKSILAVVFLLFLILADKAHGAAAVPYQQLYPSDFQTNLFPLVKLNLDPTQFNTNLTEIHISETSIIGRQYWTNLGGNLFPVGFPFNTNRFLIKASTGFTGTGTNYFGDDGVFHPLNVTIGTNDLWASVGNVYFPAQQEDSLIATNINSALSLVALGAFTMPSSLSSNLVTGENDLNAYQNGSIFLLGPTADPNDTTISLNAGSGTGQIIFIQNAQNNKGFSLTNNTPQWDASGTILLTMGDWKPTTAGQTLMLMQSQLGNWQEVGRFGGGVPSDGFWQFGVAGAGVLSPSIGSEVWATNLVGWNKLQAAGSFTTPAIHVYSVVGGSNTISTAQTSLINVNSQTNANAVVYLTAGDGDVGQHLWVFNSFTNTGFCLNTGVAVDNTNLIVLIRGDSWCPTQYGESIELVREPGGWVEINRADPHSNALGIINPTDGYMPYRVDANTFGNSPIERTAGQSILIHNQAGGQTLWQFASGIALATDKLFLVQPNTINETPPNFADTGLLVVTASPATALLQQFSPGISWTGRGWSSGNGQSEDVIFSSYNAPAAGVAPSGTLFIQSQIHTNSANKMFSLSSSSGWTGAGTKFLSDDGTYKAGGGGGATINPTDAYVPVRANSTTFNDSYLAKSGANEMYFTNSALKVDLDVTVNPRFLNPNTSGLVVHGDSASHGTIIRDDHVSTGNNQQNRIGTADGYNTYGFSADGTATATALNPQQFSENVDWIGTAYSTNAGVLRSVGMGSQLHTFGAANEPTGLLTFVSHINGVAVTNMTLSTGSAWDGSGTHFLSDDGTFKTAGGGTSYWQTNTGSGSISPLNTGTGFYITDTGQIGAGFPTNIFHGKDIGLFRQVDTSPLGATPMFVNTGIADTWPSPTYYGEWWTKLETNTATQVLVSSGPEGTFEHVWTASHDSPSSFFYYQTLSNNIPTFQLDGQSGDLSIIKSVPYSWPTASAAGLLQNDGSGNLVWETATWIFDGTNTLSTTLLGTTGQPIVQILTNSGGPWGYGSSIIFMGNYYDNITTFDKGGSGSILALGDEALATATVTNVTRFFAIGDDAAYGAYFNGGSRIALLGPGAGAGVKFQNVNSIVGIGDDTFNGTVATNCDYLFGFSSDDMGAASFNDCIHITALGGSSLYGVTLSNSHNVNSFGPYNAWPDYPSGAAFSGTWTNVTMLGGYTKATNNNDFLVGNQWHNLKLPGASFRAAAVVASDAGISSLSTDSAVSGTSAGWTNTFGKAAVIRFDGSALVYNVFNNSLTSIYTNTVAVGHGETIIQTSGKILFTGGSVSQWVAAPF